MELANAYVHFHDSLFHYVKGKVRSREDAEDILHNVFAKIAHEGEQLPQKENIKNWLFIVTRNAVTDYYRKKGKRKLYSMENEPESFVHTIAEEEYLDNTQGLDECLEDFVELLPDRYQQIVRASELEGISQKELAEKLQMPYSSLRSRVQRGRDQLKLLLTECCKIEVDRRGNILEVIPRNKPVEDSCGNCEN